MPNMIMPNIQSPNLQLLHRLIQAITKQNNETLEYIFSAKNNKSITIEDKK